MSCWKRAGNVVLEEGRVCRVGRGQGMSCWESAGVCHAGGGRGEEDICSGYVIWFTPTLTATSSCKAPPSWTISLFLV